MISLIRRQGHLYERAELAQAARMSGGKGHHYAGQGMNEGNADNYFFGGRNDWGAPSSGSTDYQAYMGKGQQQTPYQPTNDNAAIRCGSCWKAYMMDGDNSTDTSTDYGEQMEAVTLHLDHDSMDADLCQAYALARKFWRRRTDRQPRRHRFKGKSRGKGYNRHRQYKRSGWSFLADSGEGALCPECCVEHSGGSAFKGSKGGPGRGKGNPKGSNGQPLQCDNCGSDKHLWRRCDAQNAEEYKRGRMQAMRNGGKGSGYSTAMATQTPNAPPQTQASTALANWRNLTGQAEGAAPERIFFTALRVDPPAETKIHTPEEPEEDGPPALAYDSGSELGDDDQAEEDEDEDSDSDEETETKHNFRRRVPGARMGASRSESGRTTETPLHFLRFSDDNETWELRFEQRSSLASWDQVSLGPSASQVGQITEDEEMARIIASVEAREQEMRKWQIGNFTGSEEDHKSRTITSCITCPGCLTHKARGNSLHTYATGECHFGEAQEHVTEEGGASQDLRWFISPAFHREVEDLQAFCSRQGSKGVRTFSSILAHSTTYQVIAGQPEFRP